MNIKQNIKGILFWTIASIVMVANGLLCLSSVVDFYEVTFTVKEKEYHWGAEAFGWYYVTRNIYLTYTGIWTAVFLIALTFMTSSIVITQQYLSK